MADQEPSESTPTQNEPPARPAPPPYRPNEDLIGYIERGQTPPKEERKR